MASFLIHMCICDEVNKIIKKDRKKILIGSIAPDIAKLIGISRDVTHFGKYPVFNEEHFLEKYKNNLNDDFVLGYFIHLYTDYLWNEYFINQIFKDGEITMIDGKKIKCDKELSTYLYQDYDSLIEDIINTYDMDLSFLNENIPVIDNIIEEIPISKLNIILDKTKELISYKNKSKLNVMDMNSINLFVSLCKNKIIKKLNEIV